MLLSLLQHPSNGLHVFFALTLGINKDVIKIHYYKNVELFCHNLVDIILECRRCVDQSKKHDQVLEVIIAGLEGRFLFVSLPDLYLMVGIDQVKLGKISSPA